MKHCRKAACLLLVLVVLFTGCVRQPPEDETGEDPAGETGAAETLGPEDSNTPGEEQLYAADISGRSVSDEMKYQGRVVLRYDMQYPVVKNLPEEATAAINAYFQDMHEADMEIIGYYYEQASALFQQASDNNEDLPAQFSYYKSYVVMFNTSGYLSVSLTTADYTGGAHGMEITTGVTFNTRTGEILKLGDLFNVDEEVFMKRIYNEIIKKIDIQKQQSTPEDFPYFENYKENAAVPDYSGKWMLTEKGLMIVYDLYTMAPYAAGMPVFELGYSSLSDIMKRVLP